MAHITDFGDCCGACVFVFDGFNVTKATLQSLLKRACYDRSIAFVTIADYQYKSSDPVLKEFGFKRVGRPVENINTDHKLYSYQINLNAYRQRTTKKVTKSRFEGC